MKVLLVNGSPRQRGNTAAALQEMEKVFHQEGVETVWLHIGGQDVRGCVGCGQCGKLGRCVFDDAVNQGAELLAQCDGLVVGSPVYYASPNGTVLSFLDRLFRSCPCDKRMKVGAAVAAARRGGLTASMDVVNKYFTISAMPVASGTYWNGVHGGAPGEAQGDEEGMQVMRNLARNMAFLMKSIALGKEAFGLPEQEKAARTNFIR